MRRNAQCHAMPRGLVCFHCQSGWSHIVEVFKDMRLSLLDAGATLLALIDRFHLLDETHKTIVPEYPNSNPSFDHLRR
jgi:hypothetical protein